MERISNNLLAMFLVFAMIVSVLGTSMTLLKIDSFRYRGTGKVAGIVGVCVSNAPIITPIGGINISQNDNYYFDVNDTQSVHDTEAVYFWDNTSFFDINQTDGRINFTATNAMVGEHWVLIWANESACGMADSETVNFTVHNVNDAPVLDFIPDQVLYEDQIFEYDVNATDPDMLTPEGETITFGDNTTLFVINPATGNISFMPVQAEAGQNYSVLIFVFDDEYLDTQAVNFEIIVVNDAPVLDVIGAKTATEEIEFYYDVNATDEEGDPLTFYDNATIFNINSTTGVINFTPNSSMSDNYSINISVTDGALWDFEVISFTVVGTNHPPNITYWYPNELNTSRATETGNKSTDAWYYTGSYINFRVNATDPDGTTPSFWWVFENVTVAGEIYNNYTHYFGISSTYVVEVFASDGLLSDTHNWTLSILERPVDEPPGGGGGLTGAPPAPEPCFENWRCTYWSVCTVDGNQTRSCVDLNDCDTYLNRPPENRSCFYSPSPSCFDGIKNCHDGQCEIMVDCGGTCGPCPTCDDGIRNQGEEWIDCGGPCQPCGEKCIQAKTIAVDIETGECRVFESPCLVPQNWKVVDECPPIQPVYILLYIIILAFIAITITLLWLQRRALKARLQGFRSRFKVIRVRKRELTREERLGKDAIMKLGRLKQLGSAFGKQKAEPKPKPKPAKPDSDRQAKKAFAPKNNGGKGDVFVKKTLDEISKLEKLSKEERQKRKQNRE